jgi:hypothetical protein
MQSILIKAFDRRDFFSARVAHRCYAGSRRLPIQVDRAGAAKPNAAAKFRSGQSQNVSQIPKQRHFRLTAERLLNTVHPKLNHFPALAQNVCKGNELQPTTSNPG